MEDRANGLTSLTPGEHRYWQEINASQWVNREREKQLFTKAVDRIQRRSPEDVPLLEFYGGAGLGKSTLIQMLYQEAKLSPTYCALINQKSLQAEIQTDPLRLLDILLEQLYQTYPLHEQPARQALLSWMAAYRERMTSQGGPGLAQQYADWLDALLSLIDTRPDWLTELDQVKRLLIAVVSELAAGPSSPTPVIVLFDETEWTRPWLDRWIKDYVVTPLVLSRQCLVVWTGRRPTRWSHPEVHRRVQVVELQRFTEDGLKEQIARRSDNPDLAQALFGPLFEVTLGHPSATSIAYQQISAWAAQGDYQSVQAQIIQNHSLLYRQIFQELLITHAFGNLPPDQQLSPAEQKACQLLSLVRIFDNRMLETVLSCCGGELFAGYSAEDYAYLLRKLRSSQFVLWKRGNTLEENLRLMVRRYYLYNNSVLYTQVNQQARAVYDSWLQKPIDSRALYTQEELYHTICLAQLDLSIDVQAELQKRLEDFGRRINDRDALHDAVDRLWNEINTDNELCELAGPNLHARLLDQIMAYLNSLPK